MIGQIGGFEDVIEKGQSGVKNAAKSVQSGVGGFAKTTVSQITNQTPSDQGVNESNNASSQQQMSDDDAKRFLQDLYGVKNSNSNSNLQAPNPGQNPTTQKPQANNHSIKTSLGLTGNHQSVNAPTPTETIKNALGISIDQKKGPAPTSQDTIKAALGLPGEKPKTEAPSAKDTVVSALGLPSILKDEKTPEEEAQIEALRRQLHGEYYQKLTRPNPQAEESVSEKLEREDEEKKMEELESDKEKPPPLPATVKQGTGESVVGVSG